MANTKALILVENSWFNPHNIEWVENINTDPGYEECLVHFPSGRDLKFNMTADDFANKVHKALAAT